MHTPTFHWNDPFLLDQQLSEDERMVRDAAFAYCQDKLAPRVLNSFRHEQTDVEIFRKWVNWACLDQPSPPNMAVLV